MTRVVQLHPALVDDDTPEYTPAVVPAPLAAMQRMVQALGDGDHAAAASVLDRAGRRLQEVALDELHRMVGQFVTEVSAAPTLREKVSRAIVHGSRLIEAQPPQHVLRQFHDPQEFVQRCVAATRALFLFLTAEANATLARHGGAPMVAGESLITELAEQLFASLEATRADGLDRRAVVLERFLTAFGEPATTRVEDDWRVGGAD